MRINGIEVCGSEDVEVGRYFLVRRIDNNQRGVETYSLMTRPGRTNRSHEERLSGWLGETNNMSRHAEGAVEVYRDKRGALRARRIDAEELYAEVSPNTELAS